MDVLTRMRTFVAVVNAGSFAEAARQIGNSKALVSKYINELEERLGARLLNRTSRQLSLTEIGQTYYQRCVPLLEEFQELELAIQGTHELPKGKLRITAAQSFGELHLMPAIVAFVKQFPMISIDLKLSDGFVDLVEEGIDMAVRIAELQDSSLVARRLALIRVVTCATSAYLSKYGTPMQPSDLLDHTCVIDSNHYEWRFNNKGRKMTVKVNGQIKVNSALAVREVILADGGIGLCPEFIIGPDINSGRVKLILESYESYNMGIYAIYPHRRHIPNKLRTFIDFMVEYFSEIDWGS